MIPTIPVTEILLQVKFAEVDRNALNQWGINILSLPGAKNIFATSTQEYGPPSLVTSTTTTSASTTTTSSSVQGGFTVNDLLNIFLFRPDINLAATIEALKQRNILEILAEPNVLTASGKDAAFLAGGQFPYPVLQSTGGMAAISGIADSVQRIWRPLELHSDGHGGRPDPSKGCAGGQLSGFHECSHDFGFYHSSALYTAS